jgi:hypothetical protein
MRNPDRAIFARRLNATRASGEDHSKARTLSMHAPVHPAGAFRCITLGSLLLVAIGCDSLTSPGENTSAVSFSVSTSAQAGAALRALRAGPSIASAADGSLIVASGSDTLIIDSVRVVLAQVSLARSGDAACGNADNNDAADTSCTSLMTGPFIAKLPLTAGALSLFDLPVPQGSYTKFAVRVHKPNRADSGPNVQAFLDAHPDWENKSIKVDGSFNGVAVHWSHDPVAQLEHEFDPPLVVNDASNFTLQIDVASWFMANGGGLIDPNDHLNAQYPQVAAHVMTSFSVFRDDNENGHNDQP